MLTLRLSGGATGVETSHIDNAMNSFPVSDVYLAYYAIDCMPVGPRRMVALPCQFGRQSYRSGSARSIACLEHKFQLGSKLLKMDEHALGLPNIQSCFF